MIQRWKIIGSMMGAVLMVTTFLMVSAQGTVQLSGNFVGTVRLGPDKDMAWKGVLKLSVSNSGAVTGSLQPSSGAPVKVSGTVVGQSITLVFDLGGGKYVFGIGGLNRDLHKKPSAFGGTLAGPNEGDIGDWGYGIGG